MTKIIAKIYSALNCNVTEGVLSAQCFFLGAKERFEIIDALREGPAYVYGIEGTVHFHKIFNVPIVFVNKPSHFSVSYHCVDLKDSN